MMKLKQRLLIHLVTAILTLGSSLNEADAVLSLLIDSATTDSVTFLISGTFDTDTIGDQPGWLVIKNDYRNNVGVHTELFGPTAVLDPTSVFTFDGLASPLTFAINNNGFTHHDAITFEKAVIGGGSGGRDSVITAGTVVSGTITVNGIGAFNPANLSTVELASGFNGNGTALNPFRWGRFEAAPEPSRALLTLLGFGAITLRRRR